MLQSRPQFGQRSAASGPDWPARSLLDTLPQAGVCTAPRHSPHAIPKLEVGRLDLRYISTILTTQITCEEESANDRERQLVCYSNRFLHYKIEHFYGIRDLPQTSGSLLNVSTFCRIMGLTVKHSSTVSQLAYRFL